MFLVFLTSLPTCPPICSEQHGVCNREKQNSFPFPSLWDFSDIKQSLPKSFPIHSLHGLCEINIVSKMSNTSSNSSTNPCFFSSSSRKIINSCSNSHFLALLQGMRRQNWSSGSCLTPASLISCSRDE